MRWSSIQGFPGYEVSDAGLVKKTASTIKKQAGELLSQSNVHGYKVCTLICDGKKTQARVHRLVATAFLPAPADELQNQVAHNDGSRDNNHFSNLRWATGKENLADRIIHKTTLDGTRNGRAKLTPEQVLIIRERYVPRCKKNGANILAKEFGVTDVAIIKAFRSVNWKCIT